MSRQRFRRVAVAATLALAAAGSSAIVNIDHDAIQYSKIPVDDPVARFQKRLNSGQARLEFTADRGYLDSLLKALDIPLESQVLVFSKTSFQAPRIAPRLPRALYFNDTVSVGWVRGGDVLELAAVDPRQGVIFYTLDQDPAAKPRFERRDTCLQCHQSGATEGVPGLVVRSVFPDPSGMPQFHAGTFVTDHRSPLKERWGGWYVSGTHGSQTHMGNAVVRDRDKPGALETEATQNLTSLQGRFDTGAYPTPHSDIVALLVLEHQTRMTNLITRLDFETRMALSDNAAINRALGRPVEELSASALRRIHSPAEELVEYMLFAKEARWSEPIRGVSGFAEKFAAAGLRTPDGRSLRDLDLQTRLLRYPCSFLIYSEAFDNLPPIAKDRVYRRMWEVLTGQDASPKFAALSKADRRNVLEILAATKSGLPDYWLP